MRILRPTVEIIKQEPKINGIFKQIERAGRVCYKSEDKITKDSAQSFVERMVRSGHMSVLEHGTVYLSIPLNNTWYTRFDVDPFSVIKLDHIHDKMCVTTNYRVLIENGWTDLLKKYLVDRTPTHERRVTVKFGTQIAISREFNRHRANSVSESSTRYCNYSKDKFGNGLTYNCPTWISDEDIENDRERIPDFDSLCWEIGAGKHTMWSCIDWWWCANLFCEKAYLEMTRMGWTAEQARVILPIDLNTEIVHTAFIKDWKHFIDLRADGVSGVPHPDARVLAILLKEKFTESRLL